MRTRRTLPATQRLAPIDRTVLFTAKVAALLVYLAALELVAVPIFALFSAGVPMVMDTCPAIEWRRAG